MIWALFHLPCILGGGGLVASQFPPISWGCVIWHLKQNLEPSFSPQFFSYYSVQIRKTAIVQPRHNHTKKKKLEVRRTKRILHIISQRRAKDEWKRNERRSGSKMKEKQWWSEQLLVFCDGKGPYPPIVESFCTCDSLSSRRSWIPFGIGDEE